VSVALLLDKRTDCRVNGIIATDLTNRIEVVNHDFGMEDDEGSFDLAKSRRWIELFARTATERNPILDVVSRGESVTLSGGRITNRIYNDPVTDLTVLFVHGGGWVIGSLDTHDQLARLISVGYSLAPEHPFPGGVEECKEVLAKTLNSSRSGRVFVAGDSAGANIAAMAILRLDAL
jgi:acetyl esterase/lipase